MCTTTFIRYWGYCGHLVSTETVDKLCDADKCIRDFDLKDTLLYKECGSCEKGGGEVESVA